jgi:[acyl-carrier-protein] S-malonyltransferase
MSFAVLCSGQGGQHAAALEIIAGDEAAENVLEQGTRELGESARDWLAHPEAIFDNRVAQPLICLSQLAIWSALRARLPAPAAFAGYSVGELASYACADALCARELARLARRRAELMDAAAERPGGLIAVQGLDRGELTALSRGRKAWLAIVNGDDAFVVGGESEDLASLSADALGRGGNVTRIAVGLAAHTPLLDSAVAPFAQALERSTLAAPSAPVVAGIDASWVTDRSTALAKLAEQISATIEWAQCMDSLWERGCRVFLELGPGAALANMIRRRFGDDVDARSVEDFRSLEGIATWVERRGV